MVKQTPTAFTIFANKKAFRDFRNWKRATTTLEFHRTTKPSEQDKKLMLQLIDQLHILQANPPKDGKETMLVISEPVAEIKSIDYFMPDNKYTIIIEYSWQPDQIEEV